MKRFLKLLIVAGVSAAGLFLVLQGTLLFCYWWSCMRPEHIEVVRVGTEACKLTVPVKYIAYSTEKLGEHVPVYARDRVKYNIFCVPEKDLVRITLHRHLGGGFGCFMAMYDVTDPEVRKKLIALWKNETGNTCKNR